MVWSVEWWCGGVVVSREVRGVYEVKMMRLVYCVKKDRIDFSGCFNHEINFIQVLITVI